jgi:hypothetical protein
VQHYAAWTKKPSKFNEFHEIPHSEDGHTNLARTSSKNFGGKKIWRARVVWPAFVSQDAAKKPVQTERYDHRPKGSRDLHEFGLLARVNSPRERL